MEYMENEYQKSASKKFPDKKFIIAICTTVLLVITILVTLVQLFDQNSNDVHIPQLHFIVNDEIYATIETNGNEVIKLPNNPAKDGYKFDGWYWDNNLWNRPFTANSLLDEPLSSDMSVYAKFTNINIEPPTQESIINELNKIPNVVAIEAATEYNDPNGQLNKDGGYIAHIYFSVDVIKQDDVYGITLVEKGTEAGGSIEIYRNQQDAEKRNTYLTTLDGTILSSGSHKVVGTCVVRTSDILTASLQNILENNLEKMLTGKTDYVNMDTYLIQIAKTIAQNENLSEFETVSKLIGYGYPQKKSEDIAKSCGVNFNETAKYLIEGYADYYATVSPAMVSTLLSERGFSDDNISYAIEKSNVDWKWYAQIHAREFIVMYSETRVISPLDVINYLQAEKGYTKADSEYGITNDEISWDILAVNYINDFLLHNNLKTKRDYIEALANVNFTEQQIKYALDNCNIDWNTLALNNLSYYVENLCNTTPNYTQCLSKLKEWGFNDKEASYALQKYDNLIYPDKLDYVIHFNTDGGELSTLNQNVVFGKTYTLPTPTKTGYTFKGWYNGTNEVTAGTWYTASDVTLKAKWEITSYSITYNLNNGTNSSSNKSAYTTTDTIVLYPPTRRGYTFTGWTYSGQTTPIMNVTIQKGTTGKKTYTANWKVNTYTITFDANNGTVSPTSTTATFDSYVTLPTPTRVGYNFIGWYNGSTKYTTGTWKTASNTTLTAKWEAIFTRSGSQLTGFTNYGKANYTNIIIPTKIDDVAITSIGSSSFDNCSSLTSIVIPNSVTSIGNYAFYGCSSLTSVVIGDSVTSIGDWAFDGCSSLESIVIPDSVTSIGSSAFSGCSSIESVYITDIEKWCKIRFYYKSNPLYNGANLYLNGELVTNLELPNGITNIGDDAFQGCSSLTSIAIPDSVTSIGSCAFSSCSSLESVYITDIEKWCKISFDLSANPLSYGANLYLNGKLVTNLELPDSVTTIGKYAFYGCSSLESIVIPNSVTSIGYYAFMYCSSLTSVEIADGVTRIGSATFFGCSSLTNVVVPDSVTSIGDGAFQYCSSIESIVIPNSAISISSSAFGGCSSLTSIVIPDGVTSIGDGAFDDCTSLTSVVIPDGVTSIGRYAFEGCSSLTSVVIGNGVTSIGDWAFDGCTLLTSVVIGDSVTKIGDFAFSDCTSITDVYFTGSAEEYAKISIGSGNEYLKRATIHYNYVPEE